MFIKGVLIFFIIYLIFYTVRMKLEIKNISKQIRTWNGENINIRTNAINNEIEELVRDINSIYDENQKVRAENKRIDEELRRSISNMSHDLRTPLTSISGYIQLIKNDKSSEEEKKEYLDIVDKRARSLQGLITNFYDLSRLNSNDYIFNFKNINLKNILLENIATYYGSFISNDIEPSIEIQDKVSNIISDENAVNRIFSNLIGNMIKHGGKFISINLKEEENFIVTEFINSVEYSEEIQVDKIFDRFYIGDKSRTRNNTGLGLAITKALVEKLGHSIKAKLDNDKLYIQIFWKKLK
ncbi:HAMP domain-containing sensor histidine kinase [Clostridium sp. LIBA-8841]|uniref:sensor histidine kinase n=1 Tax=Clostridium sp. LIBA-8841 TaxID=2987530 RepID=UPI002AC53702|nr:HAMP domain-containing sensor histidine kinase [Clostridium sp. LIBA-8841]MDZ5253989.1 HAMP domain-containing histidine kinase [Clostridium sp. LIBA-8841]